MVTTRRLIDVTGCDRQTLASWERKKLVTPKVKHTQGKSHEFTIMQAVGFCVACDIRASERGCNLSYVGAVYDAFANCSEQWLVDTMRSGRTNFVMIGSNRRPILDGPNYKEWPDVQAIYKILKANSVAK